MWDLVYVAIFFICCLIIAHIPYIRVKGWQRGAIADKHRWGIWCERSDFLSLSLAAAALVPAAIEIERKLVGSELSKSLYLVENPRLSDDLKIFKLWTPKQEVDQYKDISDYLNKVHIPLEDGDKAMRRAREALKGNHYEEADRYLDEAIQAYERARAHGLPLSIGVSPHSDTAAEIHQGIYRYRDQAIKLKEDIKQIRSNNLELPFIIRFWPYVLAVSFAVRFAKTTSKVFLEKQKPPAPPNQTVVSKNPIAEVTKQPEARPAMTRKQQKGKQPKQKGQNKRG